MGDDGYMRPTFAQGKKTAIAKLLELRRQAQKDKEPRVVLRIQGILMSLDGHTAGEIANHLEGASQHGSAVDRSMEPVRPGRLAGRTPQRATDRV